MRGAFAAPPPSHLLWANDPPSRPSTPRPIDESALEELGIAPQRPLASPPPLPRRPGGPLYCPYKQQVAALLRKRPRIVPRADRPKRRGRAATPGGRRRPAPLTEAVSPSISASASSPRGVASPRSMASPRGVASPRSRDGAWAFRIAALMEEELSAAEHTESAGHPEQDADRGPSAAAHEVQRLLPARAALRVLCTDPAPPQRLRDLITSCVMEYDAAVTALRTFSVEAWARHRRDISRLADRSRRELADLRFKHKEALDVVGVQMAAAATRLDDAEGRRGKAEAELLQAQAELESRSVDWEMHRRRRQGELDTVRKQLEAARAKLSSREVHISDVEDDLRRVNAELSAAKLHIQSLTDTRSKLEKHIAAVKISTDRAEHDLKMALTRSEEQIESLSKDLATEIAAREQAELDLLGTLPERQPGGVFGEGSPLGEGPLTPRPNVAHLQCAVEWAIPAPLREGGADAASSPKVEEGQQFPVAKETTAEVVIRAATVIREQRELLERAEAQLRAAKRREKEAASLRYDDPPCCPTPLLVGFGTGPAVAPMFRTDKPVHSMPLSRDDLHGMLQQLMGAHYVAAAPAAAAEDFAAAPGDFLAHADRWYTDRFEFPELAQQAAYSVGAACARMPSDPAAQVYQALVSKELGGWVNVAVQSEVDGLRDLVDARLPQLHRLGQSRLWATTCVGEMRSCPLLTLQQKAALAHLLQRAVSPGRLSELLRGDDKVLADASSALLPASSFQHAGSFCRVGASSLQTPSTEVGLASLMSAARVAEPAVNTDTLLVCEVKRAVLQRVRQFRAGFESRLLQSADQRHCILPCSMVTATLEALDELPGNHNATLAAGVFSQKVYSTLMRDRPYWAGDPDRTSSNEHGEWWYSGATREGLTAGAQCVPRASKGVEEASPDAEARRLVRELVVPIITAAKIRRPEPQQNTGPRFSTLRANRQSASENPGDARGRRKSVAAAPAAVRRQRKSVVQVDATPQEEILFTGFGELQSAGGLCPDDGRQSRRSASPAQSWFEPPPPPAQPTIAYRRRTTGPQKPAPKAAATTPAQLLLAEAVPVVSLVLASRLVPFTLPDTGCMV
eukprot:TRINITY_DN32532_c0_g1_i1.p1 TRINITY_DN32532_c0_g1~~TRINITY_DN32532_c0_g1_i1.p1  ORF type:complete len:1110 (+),score=338.84 TRINITY_DN32532_c0_g1_i1:81-3332(+)